MWKDKPEYTVSDVLALTGLGRSGLYARIKKAKFPEPNRIKKRKAIWAKSAIKRYLATTPASKVKSTGSGGKGVPKPAQWHKAHQSIKKGKAVNKTTDKRISAILADSGISTKIEKLPIREPTDISGYPFLSKKPINRKKKHFTFTEDYTHHPFYVVDLYEANSFSSEEAAVNELIEKASSGWGRSREYAIVKVTHGLQKTIKAIKIS